MSNLIYRPFVFIIVFLIAMVSATNVFVSTSIYQSDTTAVIEPYFEYTSLGTSSFPSVNTQTSQPSGSGNTIITAISTGYLWSLQFGNGLSLPSGVLRVDFWVSSVATSGTLVVTVNVTDSSGTTVNTLGSSSLAITTTEMEFILNFTISSTNVPASGYISVSFSLPTGISQPTTAEIYWGASQETNFQVEEFRGVVD